MYGKFAQNIEVYIYKFYLWNFYAEAKGALLSFFCFKF